MYVPTIARFSSVDPLPLPPDGEPVLLGSLPDGVESSPPSNRYSYAGNSPLNYTDPSGTKYGSPSPPKPKAKPAAPTCTVEVECVKLVGIGGFGIAEHCGLKVTSPTGVVTRYHVPFGTTIKIVGGKVNFLTGGSYFVRDTFTVDPAICECIAKDAARIVGAAVPYNPVPFNSDCGGNPQGNSNYTTKCLLHHCGLTGSIDTAFIAPAGWNHRMQKCTSVGIVTSRACGCICYKWDTTDHAWCSSRPQADVIADPGG
jgi:hypothetical protein